MQEWGVVWSVCVFQMRRVSRVCVRMWQGAKDLFGMGKEV